MTATAIQLNVPDTDYPSGHAHTVVGDHIVFISIVHDDGADSPLDSCDCYGRIFLREDRIKRKVGFEEGLRDPDAVLIDKYEHGLVRYVVNGHISEEDNSKVDAVWVPNDCVRESVPA